MAEAIRAHRLFAAHPARGGTVVALQSLSLTVEAGELLAVIGPSGSGKSTLLRCLAGRLRPLSGELDVFGAALHELRDRELAAYRAATVAFVQQHYARSLSPDLKAWEMIAMRPRVLGWPRRHARARALELLERVGLGDRADALRTELSGGEQQRVALCAALAANPRLLLADEVTGELDDDAGTRVLAALRELAAVEGTTVVLVTHDPKATRVADRTVTVRDGRVTGELRRGATDRRVVMIDDGGVLRIDPDDLAAAGLEGEAGLGVTDGAVVLRRLGERPAPAPVRRRGVQPARVGPAPPPVTRARDVVRRFESRRRPALDGVSFDLLPGRLHVLSGPSGCGKTTLIHLIGGLDRPDAGTIEVLGHALDGMTRAQLAAWRREHVAIVPQTTALVPFLGALENVELALTVRGVGSHEARTRSHEALALIGLAEAARRPAADLSAGQRQRVAVARAVAAEPKLLLADEPTANLDEKGSVMVAGLLAELAHEHGVTILCATHDESVARRADAVIRLRNGRLDDAASDESVGRQPA
ncbi:ABC transporter ATP-binding protein [Candidatus Solirubrobacter pratensis]|uniref:ABC transporter ATP-binding protein n=1 Tax=Candidatus Solirubrobacter pratensis TaxID=1298857 RepID=UPI00041FB9F8|nr:ATP-binding cassette domain-containing protein [Candidatus Solirubrobacter pratensis]